jgi:SAM-dependent methyltransferase
MLETDNLFAGSIPENYDRYMVPLIFEPFAADLAQRAASLSPSAVLETAAGSGVVTRALAPRLPRGTSYIVTDLNQPMVDYAASRQPPDTRIKWRQADCRLRSCLLPVRRDVLSRPHIWLPRSKASAEARRALSIQRMGSHRGEYICG